MDKSNKQLLDSIRSDAETRFGDLSALTVFPGFCDVHVHFREPGFSYKETIASGSRAAAKGGFTSVCTMPNLNPVPDSLDSLALETSIIERDAVIDVRPYAAITMGEKGTTLVNFEELAPHVIAFSDDGRGVQDIGLMREAMERAAKLGKVIAAHEEDNALIGGCIHEGTYSHKVGFKGIPSRCEYGPIERDLRLAADAKCKFHVCHISCKESVELIREAKKSGVDVTCETAPHYLILDENDLIDDGRFKMNPPLRSREDREALLEGIADGTIDMIATDHAPHSEEEKSRGLIKSAFGIPGLETAFPAVYTHLVRRGIIGLDRLIELMCFAPKKRFSIDTGIDYSVWDLGEEFTVDPEKFLTKGRATPFAGMKLYGVNRMTVYGGKVVYLSDNTDTK